MKIENENVRNLFMENITNMQNTKNVKEYEKHEGI